MKKLIEEYKNVLTENSLRQQINEFYKNAIPIKGNIPDKTFFCKRIDINNLFVESVLDDDNIIMEIGETKESLFNKIYNGPDIQQYSYNEIVKYVNPSWNKYKNFIQSKNKLNLILIKTNFSNIDINWFYMLKNIKYLEIHI